MTRAGAGRTIGVIGFGQFGQLLPSILPRRRTLLVHDREDRQREAAQLGCAFVSFETACVADVVVFAVPVQHLRAVLARAAAHLRPGAWALEVSSVKTLPAAWMLEILPPTVDITCVHPLFGPQSARLGLAGRRLVICPQRGDRHLALARLAQAQGLVVRQTDPQTHDQEMAHVQALTHLIAKAMVATGRPRLSLQTQPYLHLMELCGLIEHDSEELFSAIQTLNPYAPEIVDQFCTHIGAIQARLRTPQAD
jgi:prephenate dehydrogenase